MRFSVITTQPGLVAEFCEKSILGRAQKAGRIKIQEFHLRDYAEPPHFHVDDKPFGGGAGMLLKIEPIVKAIRDVEERFGKGRKILFSAKAEPFSQSDAESFSESEKHLILICGRYEGVDERVAKYFVDDQFRLGNVVFMGGEVASLMLIESVSRLLPGVLGSAESLKEESLSSDYEAEYGQYTRPREFEGHCVPEVLLSGNHAEIRRWKVSAS